MAGEIEENARASFRPRGALIASSTTAAIACADSGAGTMPSVRANSVAGLEDFRLVIRLGLDQTRA